MSRYALRPLSDVLALDIEAVELDPEQVYELAGVYGFGRGLFKRGPLVGSDTSYKAMNRIRSGQLVMSRLKAFEGAVAVVSTGFDGSVLSPEFPTFSCMPGEGDPTYISHLCRWPAFWELLGGASKGIGARRERVHANQLLTLSVPLPPIDEQHRVAIKLDRCRLASDRASSLAMRAGAVTNALQVSTAARPDLSESDRLTLGWRREPLGNVMVPSSDLVSVVSTSTYPNVGVLSFGRGLFEKPPIDGMNTSAKTLNQIHAGQFIYSRLFAFEGSYTYVPDRFEGYFVSGEFPSFDPDPDYLDARWLANYLRSPDRWSELGVSSKGLGQRRQRVPSEAVLAYEVWLPPIEQQHDMVKAIDRADAISERRHRAGALSSALTPSLLNQAFAGLL